jgi:hypothetical protein
MATAYGGGYHGVSGVEALLADKYGAIGLVRGGNGGDEARADDRRLRWSKLPSAARSPDSASHYLPGY